MQSEIGPGHERPAGWPRSAKWLIALVPVFVIGFSVICASVLLHVRRGAWELARQSSDNLVATIEADIARNIELYDLSLQAVVDGWASDEIHGLPPRIRNLVLFDRAATAKHLGPIWVLDASGKVTVDSTTLDPEPTDHSGDDYFVVHRQNPNIGLFVSGPKVLRTGEYVIMLSRRLTDDNGRFIGVVAGAIGLSYFHDLLRHVKLAEGDILTVLNRDGTVLMRNPFDMEMLGRNLSRSAVVQRAIHEETGLAEMRATVDGTRRLYVWHSGRTPFIIFSGRAVDGIYADWRTEAWQIGLLCAVLSLLAAGLTAAFAFELRRRAAVQAQLHALATTDGLTGIANRRQFDALIDREWRRCGRRKEPLALLMIDADHFKSFNDEFGHQAGDWVLMGIATAIAEHLGRSGDCAARYGGEEFSVLMPGLGHAEAYAMAERIREAVQLLPFDRTITISVGVAAIVPSADLEVKDLISEADAALYDAKARGRNQSSPRPKPVLRVAA